ncbi:hypothetical protein KP509_09G099700 [Ceratopteris richardii]|uniref:O-GlcNAc transferase C-terminal domain-containing protein n=1 Tax=Ceratopteris richardii TaxID=49495 RepID=A0A8T2UDB5_CERRI|nr:hypothetical protein KP509_09G099700 [Ceratopteris richardii]
MGVPCVTMAGTVHANNVGVTLLHQVGLENLIARNEDEYVRKAVDFASDVPMLANTRMSLRGRMLKSYLCNGTIFVRNLEGVYRSLWHRYCEGDVPSLQRSRLAEPSSERLSARNNVVDVSSKELPFNSLSLPNGLARGVIHPTSKTAEGTNDDADRSFKMPGLR